MFAKPKSFDVEETLNSNNACHLDEIWIIILFSYKPDPGITHLFDL
jgi:hypothetical protein